MAEKLTKKGLTLLEWIGRTTITERQAIASGLSRSVTDLLVLGYARLIDHPTVKEPGSTKVPATAVEITPAGRAALQQEPRHDRD